MTAIWTPETDPWATDPATWPSIITRVYRGNAASVTAQMQFESTRFQQVGYAITSQNHLAGEWGCGPFLAAAILILALGIGLLILIYLVAVKPDGTDGGVHPPAGPGGARPGACRAGVADVPALPDVVIPSSA